MISSGADRRTALVVGAGLGGMSTALRLATKGYDVTVLEKDQKLGGRLNQIKEGGYTFDMGPSFYSMSYEFDQLFKDCGVGNPIQKEELDPVYAVYFDGKEKPYLIYKDLKKLAKEFEEVEPDFLPKAVKYLKKARELFHDTEDRIIKKNFDGKISHYWALSGVPLKHAPLLFSTMWKKLEKQFDSEDVRIIFSLVSFFLGNTPFNTPSVYRLLNYTELQHDGYWSVKGGMYKIVEEIEKLCLTKGVKFVTSTEIVSFESSGNICSGLIDKEGKKWEADVIVVNGDAAAFRGKVMKRKKFSEERLDKMKWTLAPLTIYLGLSEKLDDLYHHNYFLGSNFREYANSIFTSTKSPDQPYYYVNVSSKSNPECAPKGGENVFILCPVPDLRYKTDWSDRDDLVDLIIHDFGKRIGRDLTDVIEVKKVMDPRDWQDKFNLYRGSGLGLSHSLNQIGGLRPNNFDEKFSNLYYVGASTTPGTGLPMVLISSHLVTKRIMKDHHVAAVV